jgi:hypothetical protein
MNLTIASFALLSSLTSVTTSNVNTHQVVPAEINTFSKDEIVKILETEQLENQKIDDFIVSLPKVSINKRGRVVEIATLPKNNTTAMLTKTTLSTDD